MCAKHGGVEGRPWSERAAGGSSVLVNVKRRMYRIREMWHGKAGRGKCFKGGLQKRRRKVKLECEKKERERERRRKKSTVSTAEKK